MTRDEILGLAAERDRARDAYYATIEAKDEAAKAATESLKCHRVHVDARNEASRVSKEAWQSYRSLDRKVRTAVQEMRGLA